MKTLLILALLLSFNVNAKPIAAASAENITVTLTDEPCKLIEVSNLQRRATWTEAGRVSEGCWAPHPMGMVLLYFADRTVVMIPSEMFQKLGEA